MKRSTLQVLLAITMGTMGAAFTTGCINSHRAARPTVVAVPASTTRVVVTEAPPAGRHEVVGTAPSENHVWVPGYWMRSDSKWIWIDGHWESRPRTDATWVPGQWDENPNGPGWVWTPGHWD